jgi:hypothetical protein
MHRQGWLQKIEKKPSFFLYCHELPYTANIGIKIDQNSVSDRPWDPPPRHHATFHQIIRVLLSVSFLLS